MKEICNGKINSSGFCEKCYEVSQTTSGYCSRLVDVAPHPEPPKDRQSKEEILARKRFLIRDGIEWVSFSGAKDAMQEYAEQYHKEQLASQSQSLPSVLPSEEEINRKIFLLCSEMKVWDGKTLHTKTTVELLNEFAVWFKSQLKPGYPKEFVRWLSIKIKSMDIKLGLPVMYRYNNDTYTLDELFTYWQTEVNGR